MMTLYTRITCAWVSFSPTPFCLLSSQLKWCLEPLFKTLPHSCSLTVSFELVFILFFVPPPHSLFLLPLDHIYLPLFLSFSLLLILFSLSSFSEVKGDTLYSHLHKHGHNFTTPSKLKILRQISEVRLSIWIDLMAISLSKHDESICVPSTIIDTLCP